MNNNDILLRLRYALDMKDIDMVEMFRLGGVEVTLQDVKDMLTKQQYLLSSEDDGNVYVKSCDNALIDSFFNGFITFKRGPKDDQVLPPQLKSKEIRHINNLLLKKVKIGLALTSEDMLEILDDAGVYLSKGELSAVLRKDDHRNFKQCGDKFARNFLKGLAFRYRK
ncbi:YehS family protein [Brochothrix campestris]|uniref:Cytoplasmic protein n=1 Tax=Brochothrix campestris FSL F6-1037 TaxID=1265861 RepID=W7CJ41_9LIST|nr:DUF1456 family protein [Brochothrix campestris]EUJ39389.1 hypothetical protein BCAMP_07120 [Brochothrix campestris FSL F6-1037]